jgi:hypothetical protein
MVYFVFYTVLLKSLLYKTVSVVCPPNVLLSFVIIFSKSFFEGQFRL